MIIRLALVAVVGLIALMVAVRILVWQWRPVTRPCRWFGHDKRYVALKTTGCVALSDPRSNGKPFTCGHDHKIGETNIYVARWACRRCPVMQEDCLGIGQDWKIDHEQLIPDVKKWANWSQDPPPPAEPTAAREKLKELQRRIEAPQLVTIKVERSKDKVYCETCGWSHAGPCFPG